MAHAEQLVAIGERPPGSRGSARARDYLSQKLAAIAGMKVQSFPFRASTPQGELAMVNLAGVLPGEGSRLGLISCHYDTLHIPGRTFVGANDAAVACGAVLELARALAGEPRALTLWFLFYDGEEALQRWSVEDSLYGSREWARDFARRGWLPRIDFVVNLDMIGDRDLDLVRDLNSDPGLVEQTAAIARRLGLARYFFQYAAAIEDDHWPLARQGVPALDLIDFHYGGRTSPGAYWHTPEDTLDKLAPESVEAVGRVTLELVRERMQSQSAGVRR